ncbi:LAFA_0A07580g1_1 [Lachancea sp. 'fantastica']|nr:LAFA_0A07580g1_1 [Lachancea sp. 'fantastica']
MLEIKAFLSKEVKGIMSSGTVEHCIQWAQDNGAYIDDKIEFKEDALAGVHAIAKKSVKSSDPLLKIPKKLILRRSLAEDHFGVKATSEGNPNALLQLYLAKLKFDNTCSESAFFEPYLNILPTVNAINSPYFWSGQELAAMKGTELLIKTKRNLKKLVSEWFDVTTKVNATDEEDTQFYLASSSSPNSDITDMLKRSNSPKWHSFEAYLWASYIFSSRAFPELIFEGSAVENPNQAFLLPVVDLLNHANGKKVSWKDDIKDNAVTFTTSETLSAGKELFNNYGDKSNEELLMCYGFAFPNNEFDTTTLTLRFPQEQLGAFHKMGIKLDDVSTEDSSVNFTLSVEQALPAELIKVFGVLNKLTSEAFSTTRSTLEGTVQLNGILDQKLSFFKTASKLKDSLKSPEKSKYAKAYLTGQKRIYQEASDSIKKYQKKLIKVSKPVSFKTLFKQDVPFVNSLTLTFGVAKYDDLLAKGFLQQALLLWLVRNSNGGLQYKVPEFIDATFQDVAATIVVEKEDVQEYLPFYKSLFPQITTKIPEVYNKGDWGIKKFIIAGTVIDRLVWTLPTSQEALFFEKKAV